MYKSRSAVRSKGKSVQKNVGVSSNCLGPQRPKTVLKSAGVYFFLIIFSVSGVGSANCSARGRTEPDGTSAWEFTSGIAGKAEAHGRAASEPQARRAPDE